MTKSVKQLFLIIFDAIAINFSFYLAFFVRFEGDIIHFSDAVNYIYVYSSMFIWITLVKIIVFYIFKMYSSLWRYASVEELFQIVLASVVATAATVSLMTAFDMGFPRSIYLLTFIFDTMLLGSIRFSYRFFQESLFGKLGLFYSLHVGGQNTFLPLLRWRSAFKNLTQTAKHKILSVCYESKTNCSEKSRKLLEAVFGEYDLYYLSVFPN